MISGTKVSPHFHFLGEEGQRLSDDAVSGSPYDYEDRTLFQGRHVYDGASKDKL